MRHDKPQRISMVGRERPAVMMRGEQHVLAIEVGERDVGGESLLRVDEHVGGSWIGLHALHHFAEGDASPAIVEAAPARDAVEVTRDVEARESVEFFPREAERAADYSPDLEVPTRGI